MRALLVPAMLLLAARPAAAHAFLDAAEPGVGSTVATAPAQVLITFTEGIEPAFSTIAVQDATGAAVTAGPAHAAGDRRLAVALKALPSGTYLVRWHVVAVDTHRTEGSFRFTVGR